jgi:hypothetical protein
MVHGRIADIRLTKSKVVVVEDANVEIVPVNAFDEHPAGIHVQGWMDSVLDIHFDAKKLVLEQGCDNGAIRRVGSLPAIFIEPGKSVVHPYSAPNRVAGKVIPKTNVGVVQVTERERVVVLHHQVPVSEGV